MSFKRLTSRVPNAYRLAVVSLEDRVLRFQKASKDGSAKCDIPKSKGDVVKGVLFIIPADEKAELDRVEGLGDGYEEVAVEVACEAGNRFVAVTYVATKIDRSLKPYPWYKEHVLIGANEAELPRDYIDRIEIVTTLDDRDIDRSKRELKIYDRK